MKKVLQIISGVVVFSLFLLFTTTVKAQPAFPGAEGGGAVSIGGRGGEVIEVTNLENSGEGSFRAACEATGPRFVVFKVGGTIIVKDDPIVIRNPYITIAGQTAPGDGIMIRSDESMTQSALILSDCHDVIIQYIRMRPGPFAEDQAGDGFTIYKTAYNVIIDHCSISWASDENTEVWSKATAAYNFTWSYNLVAEGYGSHSCGFNSGSDDDCENMHDISIHHNMFIHNGKRNPLMKVKTSDVINNIIYGWKYFATQIRGGLVCDIIGNKYVAQDGYPISSYEKRKEILWNAHYDEDNLPAGTGSAPATGPVGDPSIYFEGNIGPHNSDPNASDAWSKMTEVTGGIWDYTDGDPLDISFKRTTRRSVSNYQITVDPVSDLDGILIPSIGASKRLSEDGSLIDNRDIVDTRIINDYLNGTGAIPDAVEDLDYPNMQNGTAYVDNDHDGMADIWETNYGLNPNDASDRNLKNLSSEGYTNLEVFLYAIDVIPPTVTSTNPNSGAVDVTTDATVSITFSEPMNKSTVSATGISVTGTSWSGNAITLAHDVFEQGKTYTVIIKGEDEAGNQLSETEFSFTTESSSTPRADSLLVYYSGSTVNPIVDVTGNGHDINKVRDSLRSVSSGTALGNCIDLSAEGTTYTNEDGEDLNITNSFTIMAFVNASTGHGGVFNYSGFSINTWDMGDGTVKYKCTMRVDDDSETDVWFSLADATAVLQGTWHHIAFTYDGTDVKIYLDGQEKFTQNYAGHMINELKNNHRIAIGYGYVGQGSAFKGQLDEAKIFDIALSAMEIKKEYSQIDNTVPVVKSTIPTNSSTDVSLDLPINITFSKEMDKSTVMVEGIDITSHTWIDNTLIISHQLFNIETDYTLTVNGSDLLGNIMQEYSFSFKTTSDTVTELDTTMPTVLLTVPVDSAINVSLDTPIRIAFSEPMDKSTVEINGLIMRDTSWVGNTLEVYHQSLTRGAVYIIKVNGSDMAGNIMKEYSFIFTTEGQASTKIDGEEHLTIFVYPNPVSTGKIYIQYEGEVGLGVAQFYNSEGVVVKIQPLKSSLNIIDVKGLKYGIYIVRVISVSGEQYFKKLVVN